MKIETLVKTVQVMGYSSDPDNYDLVFHFEVEGDMALIQGLKGDGFYENFPEIFDLMSLEYGINYIFGTMTPRHVKIAHRILGKNYKIKIIRKLRNAGRKMFLVMLARH